MELQIYSFLFRESFDKILQKHVNQRKINRSLMDINRCNECLNVLKNLSLKHNPKQKYWITDTFKIIRIGTTEELHFLNGMLNR